MDTRFSRKRIEKQFSCKNLLGDSQSFCKALHLAKEVSKTSTAVLLRGESGTGKDLLAHAIHLNSTRSSGPYIPINCASIPVSLLESELFGYEAGAFTGATDSKKGKFELATGGSLFLDEIGDMNLDVQAKLLRLLEEKKFLRLGGTEFIDSDVRIIAATNRDLIKLIEEKKFREDLYYRVSVFPIHLPRLRNREHDIVVIANYFLKHFSMLFKKQQPTLSSGAERLLANHSWNGNVRELKNVIERAMILCNATEIRSCDLFLNHKSKPEQKTGDKAEIDQFIQLLLENRDFSFPHLEARIIYHAVRHANFNVTKASRLLGLPRPTLRYRLEKYRDDIQGIEGFR